MLPSFRSPHSLTRLNGTYVARRTPTGPCLYLEDDHQRPSFFELIGAEADLRRAVARSETILFASTAMMVAAHSLTPSPVNLLYNRNSPSTILHSFKANMPSPARTSQRVAATPFVPPLAKGLGVESDPKLGWTTPLGLRLVVSLI